MNYEIRDSQFNVIGTAAEIVDGPEVPEWRRADATTLGKAAGVTCIAIRVADGVAVAGFGRRPGRLLHAWRHGLMPGAVRGAA